MSKNTVKNTPVLYCSVCNAALALRGATQRDLVTLPMLTISLGKAGTVEVRHSGCEGVSKWFLIDHSIETKTEGS